LACADEIERNTTNLQIEKFNRLQKVLLQQDYRLQWVHAANSAASLNYSSARFNLIRPGIAIYGINPSTNLRLPEGFGAALSWKTILTEVKNMPPESGISYGHRYKTKNYEKIGVISVGYGDGFRRVTGNEVLLHGIRVPVVGNVCMDQCMLQLDQVTDAKVGDEVVILGRQGNNNITAEDIGCRWGTIAYETVCGLAARIPRIYYKT